MASRAPLVLTLTLGLATAMGATAQNVEPDCSRTPAARDPASTAYSRRGDYCDGSLERGHSRSGDLPVIGVTAAPVTGDPSARPVLIGVLPGAVSPNASVQLQGVAKSPEVNYRFDAALRSDSLRIGLESALTKFKPRGLNAGDVAWVAWTDSPTGRTYVPVVTPGASPSALEILVRPAIAGGYIVYSLRNESGQVMKKGTLAGSSKPGEPVSLTLPAAEPRPASVRMTAVDPEGQTQAVSISLAWPRTAK